MHFLFAKHRLLTLILTVWSLLAVASLVFVLTTFADGSATASERREAITAGYLLLTVTGAPLTVLMAKALTYVSGLYGWEVFSVRASWIEFLRDWLILSVVGAIQWGIVIALIGGAYRLIVDRKH
jgi:hypothetical protein